MMRKPGLQGRVAQHIGGGVCAIAPRSYQEHGHPHGLCLLTNNDFSSGTTGWTGTNATLSESAGVLLVTNTGSNGYAWQTVTVEDGETYEIEVRFINGGPNVGQVEAVSGLVNYNSGNLTTEQVHRFEMVADGTSLTLRLLSVGGAASEAEYDYACIRKIS
jgi:hypothetical protein